MLCASLKINAKAKGNAASAIQHTQIQFIHKEIWRFEDGIFFSMEQCGEMEMSVFLFG